MGETGIKVVISDYGEDNDVMRFDNLYDGSAFTWEGLKLESQKDAEEIFAVLYDNGFVNEDGIKYGKFVLHRTTGADFNARYSLHGDNRYPDDLTIVSIDNSSLHIMKMLPIQIRFGARWFDDIVWNNQARETGMD